MKQAEQGAKCRRIAKAMQDVEQRRAAPLQQGTEKGD